MFQEKRFMFMICESPLHAGSGSELDFIDQPIQRERHTQFPKIESSSLKGAIRERFYSNPVLRTDTLFAAAFGAEMKEQEAGKERQGGLAFTDARLFLFPVKSMKGVFAWITCPFVLERFMNDMKRLKPTFEITGNFNPSDGKKAIVFFDDDPQMHHVILEEYAFEKEQADVNLKVNNDHLNKWLATRVFSAPELDWWKTHLEKNLVIVSDDDFADFTELSTEVITRNRIDPDKGTVVKGALFTEEYLPTDSVLYTIALAHAEFAKNGSGKTAAEVMNFFHSNMNGSGTDQLNNAFRAGGNETIGKGIIRTVII